MTSLYGLSMGGTACKSSAIGFEIKKKLFYPSFFKGRFFRGKLDSALTHTPIVNEELIVQYGDAISTSYDVFKGKITKVIPNKHFYDIEAVSGLQLLFSCYATNEWYSTDHDDIIVDLLDATAGPLTGAGAVVYTITNNVSYPNNFSYFRCYNQLNIDVIRKLCLASADGAGEGITVLRQSDSATNTLIIEDLGETVPATDITIQKTDGLRGDVRVESNAEEIVNKIIARCKHGNETRVVTDVDGTSTSLTNYNTRLKKLYLPEVMTQTNARYFTDTILRNYSEPYDVISFECYAGNLHGNSTHYPVINTLYTVIDPVSGTTYADKACIEHILRWPSFTDTVVLGKPSFSLNGGDYYVTANAQNMMVESSTDYQSTYMFHAYKTASQTIEGTPEEFIYSAEYYDIGTSFSTSTGRYTAPATGMYEVYFSVALSNVANLKTVSADLTKGGTTTLNYTDTQNSTGSAATITAAGSWTGPLAKGEYISVFVGHDDTVSRQNTAVATDNYLRGRMIY